MEADFLYPEAIDERLNWPLGTAARLARRRILPYHLLPDGSARFRWAEIEPLIHRVPHIAAPEVQLCNHTS